MWYPSAMNYDMMSPNPWNTMNLHMNQLWDHSSALSGMYNVPLYSFDNFLPYGNMAGNAYLTNPFYTLNQMSWGTPAWNNLPWNNGNMNNVAGMGNMWSPWGWNPSNNNGGSNDGNLTAEEKGYQRKYNTLLSLAKQLRHFDELTNSQKDALDVAIRDTKGSYEEKFKRLEEAYKGVDKDTIRVFLKEKAQKVGVSKEINENDKDKDSFFNRLLAVGHDYDDLGIDSKLNDFYDGIKTLDSNNGTSQEAEGIIGQIKDGTYDILDFISSWNNNYKEDSEAARVIDFIEKYYNEVSDDDLKKTAKSKILKPFVDTLITKAQSVKGSLDKDSKAAIEAAISEVRESLNNSNTSIDSNLSEAFDRLYLLTRRAALAELANDAVKYYGEIDSAVFNQNMFKDDMIEDLISEGFEISDIENAEVSLNRRINSSNNNDDDGQNVGNRENSINDNDPAVTNIAKLKDKGCINQITGPHSVEVVINGTKTTISVDTLYEEVTATGDSDGDKKADYKKLYYINEAGILVELTNTKYDETTKKTAKVNSADAEEKVVKASDIEKRGKVAEQARKDDDKTSVTFNAKSAGEEIAEYLNGITDGDAEKEIASRLAKKNVNKDTIIDLLEGFYNKIGDDLTGKDGIIESLDDDTSVDLVSMDLKKNIIESILKKAEELDGCKETNAYKQLKHVYKRWQDTHGSAEDFQQHYKGGWGFLNSWTGTCYNEEIDTQIKNLYDEIKSCQADA